MTQWRYYNHAAIPTTAPHELVDTTLVTTGAIWHQLKQEPLMAKWISDFDCGYETNFWYCIRDGKFDLSTLSSSARKNINRGFKKVRIEKINPVEHAEAIYKVYEEACKKYENFGAITLKETFIKGLAHKPDNLVYYGGFEVESDMMVGWLNVVEHDIWCEIQSAKFWPEYQNTRVSDALYATVLDEYLNKQNKQYVSSGSRNISHSTNTQEYKEIHFGYRKAYCKLHVAYNPKIKWIIKLIYPFRGLLKKLDRIGIVHQINSVLKMEEIVRQR